jgi:hypothetical protein
MGSLRIGSATADITPDWPLDLAGFAARTEPSRGVSQPLHLRVAVLESDAGEAPTRSAIVSADLVWWGPQHLPSLRRELSAVTGAPEDAILFSATHTHSGPQTSTRTHPGVGVVDPLYLELLTERTLAATRAALADLEPATIRRHVGTHDLGFNRRPQFDPHGPVDPILTVIRFDRADGSPKTLMVHYACHPVITQEPLVSGEWPGVAMETLEASLGVTALYLQGCCGDINPHRPGTDQSLRGTDQVVVREGRRFAAAVEDVLATPGTALAPVPLRARNITVDLPFAALPDEETLEPAADDPHHVAVWKRALLAHPEWRTPTIPLRLQRLDLADGLALLAMDGEIVVTYGLRIRERSGGSVLPLGYANGMTGYVPTAKLIAEGGYEGGASIPWFFLPAPFDPSVEPTLNNAIDDALSG